MMTRMIMIAAAALSGAAPALAQPPEDDLPAAARPGDDQLSCAALGAESLALQRELGAMSSEITGLAAAQMRAARAQRSAGIASSIVSAIPIIGGIAGQVASSVVQGQQEAQSEAMLEASDRMMTRGLALSERMTHIEMLRDARCRGGQGIAAAAPEAAGAEEAEEAG